MDNSLINLIKSLTGREKAFFRKFNKAFKSNKTNYELIFDHIIKYGTIDRNALDKEHGDKNFVKYLSSEKEYLFDKVLASLVNYHFNDTTFKILIKQLMYIRVLLDKGRC